MAGDTIICRLCRTPLLHAEGCDVCRGWKKDLAVLGDSPIDEHVDLADLTAEALAYIRRQLRSMRRAQLLAQDKAHRKGEHWGPSRQEIQDSNVLLRGLATLVGETRKVRSEGIQALSAMPFQEKAELFVHWFKGIPAAHRRRVFEMLTSAVGTVGLSVRVLDDGSVADPD